jgi:hypothetical protein
MGPLRLGRVGLIGAVLAITACMGESTTAAAPTRVCGRDLYTGAMGMFTYNVWTANKDLPPMPRVVAQVPAGKSLPAVLLRVAPTCRAGAALDVTPPGGLVILNTVAGDDGRPVAVSLQGGAPGPVTLSVTLAGKTRQLHFVVVGG